MENCEKLELKCLFCFSNKFVLPDEEYVPKPGEMVQCGNCGKLNDYDSLMRVAIRKAEEWGKEQVEKELEKFMKKLNKAFK